MTDSFKYGVIIPKTRKRTAVAMLVQDERVVVVVMVADFSLLLLLGVPFVLTFRASPSPLDVRSAICRVRSYNERAHKDTKSPRLWPRDNPQVRAFLAARCRCGSWFVRSFSVSNVSTEESAIKHKPSQCHSAGLTRLAKVESGATTMTRQQGNAARINNDNDERCLLPFRLCKGQL